MSTPEPDPIRTVTYSPLPQTLDTSPEVGGENAGPITHSDSHLSPATDGPSLPATQTQPRAESGSRFLRLRPLGKGGLGEVNIALDQELNREVALKEVQARHLEHPESIARFLREAEVTGHLEHPGVVPVYGLGAYPDGRPFYAMRLIRGESLQQAIDQFHKDGSALTGEQALAFRGLLRRFVDVCNAMAYAHSRGILHRDLKPANVMLGTYGETLVIDWGLAKLVGQNETAGEGASLTLSPGSEVSPTRTGAIAGTPAFMSPEQADGIVKELTAASDVYSLGAVLYALLTGRAPFSGRDMQEILNQVRQGKFASPRQLNRATPPSLEAICLKAMATKPESRYASAKDLAADVDRWLADEPVTAYPEPWRDRLRRWSKRNRTLVTGMTVLLLTATAALGVGLWLVNQERERTEQARKDTAIALGKSERAEKSASEQRQLALKTVRSVVDEIHAELKDIPAQQKLRKKLLGVALDGLKEVARAVDTADADHATLWALFELGDIFLYIDIGGVAEARKQYDLAHDLACRLASSRSEQSQRDLFVSLAKLGDVQLRQGDTKTALVSYQECLKVCRQFVDADPRSTKAQRDLSLSLSRLGDVQMQQGASKAALVSYQEALKVCRQLADADPGSALAQRDLSLDLERLGDVQLRQGANKAALASYQEALEIRRQLVDVEPRSVRAQRDLADSLNKLGNVQLQLGASKAAQASYEKSLGIRRQLVVADPHSAQAQRDLAVSLNKLGDVQMLQGDSKAALAPCQEALKIRRQLVVADPRSAEAQRGLGSSLEKLGNVQLEQGDSKSAMASYQEALKIGRQLAIADPGSAQTQRDLFVYLNRLGEVQLQQGNSKSAMASYQEALKIGRQLAVADPRSAEAQRDLLFALRDVGIVAEREAEFGKAVEWYLKALDVPKRFPTPEYFTNNVRSLENHVRFCRAAEQALDDLSVIDKQPADDRALLLALVNKALVQRKGFDKAVLVAEKLGRSAWSDENLLLASLAHARCIPLAKNAEAKQKLSARAISLLTQAVRIGFRDVGVMIFHPDLDPLRQRDDFKKLLAELEREH